MEFVEEYLKEVVNQPFPFGDKEKNKLTFEVFWETIHSWSYSIFPVKKLDTLNIKIFPHLGCFDNQVVLFHEGMILSAVH